MRTPSTRLVVAAMALLLLVQVAGLWAARSAVEQATAERVDGELDLAQRVWTQRLGQRAQALADAADALAGDAALRAAVAARDPATAAAILDRPVARGTAVVDAVLDAERRPVAVSRRAGVDAATIERLAAGLGGAPSGLARVGDQPVQVVQVPLRGTPSAGWVLLAADLEPALLDDVKAVSGADVVLRGADGERAQVLQATSPAAAWPALVAASAGAVTLDGTPHRMRRLVAGEAGVEVLLLRPAGDVALAPLLGPWLTITAVAALLVGGLGLGVARDLAAATASDAPATGDAPAPAATDPSTGLPTRPALRDTLQRAVAARSPDRGALAVLVVAPDRVEDLAASFGDTFAQRLVAAMAARLRALPLRDGERLARLDGERFALLLLDVDRASALAAAQRLATHLAQPLAVDGSTVERAARIGVAAWPHDAGDADTLLARAEAALAVAQRQSTEVATLDAADDVAGAAALALVSPLRRAAEEGQLRLHLQPRLSLADGGIVGAEALVRWQHPQRGLLAASEFVALAEHTGAVRELTLWVFDAAARRWEALRGDGVPLRLSVNLAARDLLDVQTPTRLDAVLARWRVPPQAFCLEVTERALLDDPRRAEAALHRLADRGFRLAVDGFGAGVSSLASLARLPVNELKIDRLWVSELGQDARQAALVRSTIALGHALGLNVVAVGVEDASTWRQLRDWGCDEGQGFHMSPPVPVDDLPAWCHDWRSRTADGATATTA